MQLPAGHAGACSNLPNTEMMKLLETQRLEEALLQFARDRDWEQHHAPRNLLMALVGEVGELAEIFQWLTDAQAAEAMQQPDTARHIGEEMADVMMYLVRLASVLGVDLDAAVRDKLVSNARTYPPLARQRPDGHAQP
jgi:NTP pyrophosphatase (non-canonical NTP hydrolase)